MPCKHDIQKKHRHPLRMGAVIAATMALLTVGASAAANPEFLEGFTMQIASVLQVGELRQDMTTGEGVTISTLELPEARVEDRGGRAILVVLDQEIDITDSLTRDGQYEYKYEDEGAELTVLVEGSPEDWTMTTSTGVPGQEGMISMVTTKEEQDRDAALPSRYFTGASSDLEQGAEGQEVPSVLYDGKEAAVVRTGPQA